jgi:WD40 repeat protein
MASTTRDEAATVQEPPGADATIFISYSRRDGPWVDGLVADLERRGRSVWRDQEDIPPAARWRDELTTAIEAGDAFVVVVSPDSVRSPHCAQELEHALALGKRIVPVLYREADDVPEPLASRQYVLMRAGDDRERGLDALERAIDTDLDWVRGHTRWLDEALRWTASGRDGGLLLRGSDLTAAESWLAQGGARKEPRPTELQATFIQASRAAATRRLRVIVGAVAIALVVAVGLGIIALLQRNEARDQAEINKARQVAASSVNQLGTDPERGLLLALWSLDRRATTEGRDALRQAVAASPARGLLTVAAGPGSTSLDDVAWSRDGRLVAAASGPAGEVTAWRPGEPRATVLSPGPGRLDSLQTQIRRVAVNADGTRVAAGDRFGGLRVWDVARPSEPWVLPHRHPQLRDVTAVVVPDERQMVLSVAFCPGGAVLAARHDGVLIRWTPGSPAVRRPIPQGLFDVEIAPGCRRMAIQRGGRVTVSRIDGRGPPAVLRTPSAASLRFSDDGSALALAGYEQVQVWRPATGRLRTFRAKGAAFWEAAVSRDGRTLAAAALDGRLLRWDLTAPGAPPETLLGHAASVKQVALGPPGAGLVSGGDDGTVRLWGDPAWRWVPLPERALAGPGRSAQLTPDGHAVAGDEDDLVLRWDLARRTPEAQVLAVGGAPGDEGASGDGTRLVDVHGGAVRLYDDARGEWLQLLPPERDAWSAAISRDGRWAAAATIPGLVALWSLETATVVRLEGHDTGTQEVAFSADGARVAASAIDGSVRVWETSAPGARAVELVGAHTQSHDLELSAGGRLVASANVDGAARVWALERPDRPTVLRGHKGAVYAVAFSPDGRTLATGGQDGTVRIWSLADGATPVVLAPEGGPVNEVAFSRDGRTVFAAAQDRGVLAWTCDFCGPIDDVAAGARGRSSRSLTDEERRTFIEGGGS